MHSYKITWGPYEPVTVAAEDETAAWATYCETNEDARRHPKAHERTIEEVKSEPRRQATAPVKRSSEAPAGGRPRGE